MYVVTVEPLQVGADGSAGGAAPSTGQSSGSYGWGPFGLIGPHGGSPAPQAYSAPMQGMSDRVGRGIAAQLLSVLGNSGNIVVIDYDHYLRKL